MKAAHTDWKASFSQAIQNVKDLTRELEKIQPGITTGVKPGVQKKLTKAEARKKVRSYMADIIKVALTHSDAVPNMLEELGLPVETGANWQILWEAAERLAWMTKNPGVSADLHQEKWGK